MNIIRIHIIDFTKKVAIFEFLNEKNPKYRYKLMIATSKTYLYPIIINHSTEKQFEFRFEDINFDILLK